MIQITELEHEENEKMRAVAKLAIRFIEALRDSERYSGDAMSSARAQMYRQREQLDTAVSKLPRKTVIDILRSH